MSLQGTANVFLTDDVIMKQALRLLKNNLVMASLVHRKTEPVFSKKGDTINLEKPFRTKTASGRTLVVQPMVDQNIAFTINHHEHFALEVNQRDRTLSLENYSKRYLNSGIVQLANVIDRSLMDRLNTDTFYGSGSPGNAINAIDPVFIRAHMTNVGVPDDGQVSLVLNPLDCAEVSSDLSTLQNQDMVKTSIQKGYKGELGTMRTFESANIASHTVAAHAGTPLVNGAGQTGTSLITDGWNNSITMLNLGDVFTIANVNEVNPQNYTSTGRLQRFTVTVVGTSDGSGDATLTISPSLNDGTLTTVDSDGNNVSLAAFQNVDAAPANNAAITVIGTLSTTYRNCYAFHKDAIALCMVDLELPEAAVVKARIRDPDTGLALSMTAAYDIQNHTQITRIDAVWGELMIYPELAHRFYSS